MMDPAPLYRVDDQSVLLGVYRRVLWDRLTRATPAWIHPNVLTIASQVCAIAGAVLSSFAASRGMPKLFAWSALSLLMCLTLDNIDGAHARRTNQCSALGELLDHGLDGIASAATLLVTCNVLHLEGPLMVVLCGLGALAFGVVFWEQLRTGVLRLPKVSPTEGITILAIWELLSFVFDDPPWLRFAPRALTAGTVAAAIFVVTHAFAIVVPLVRARRHVRVHAREVAPFFVLSAAQLVFVVPTGSRATSSWIAAVTVGVIAANVTCHMIQLRQRKTVTSIIPAPLWALVVPAALALASPSYAPALGAASLGIALASYAASITRGVSGVLRPSGAVRA